MKRTAITNLLAWKNSPIRKPLLLQGARQVGKTFLMKEFGKLHFTNVAYLNFDDDDTTKMIFDNDFDISRIITSLQLKTQQKIIPNETLIIFDEIQEAPRAVTSLKYFCENAPQYHIIAAGSLLGVATLEGSGFPVGKVETLTLYPMTFSEFLIANGREDFVELLNQKDWQTITTFKAKFIDYLRHYYFVGGMPEAVASFIAEKDFAKVRQIQLQLLNSYKQDFAKHAPVEILARIRLIWDSIAPQLAKENKKFQYSKIKKGARSSEFEQAIQWLKDAGLIYLINRITKPHLPISSYKEDNIFKMFTLDIGLLGAQSDLDAQVIIEGNCIFTEFKGALTEQYVLQQLIAELSLNPFYWANSSSSGEIDFVFQHAMEVIPLEVKAEENLKAKSLMSYASKYKTPHAIRCSMVDYRTDIVNAISSKNDLELFQFRLTNLPLYAISQLKDISN